MGEDVWRETGTWPPDYIDTISLYFGENGILSSMRPVEPTGYDRYKVDFKASTGKCNRWFTNPGHGDVVYPNHSFKRSDAMPLVPGEIAGISFKLYATSVQIKKGHGIRIALAGADESIFNRFPEEGDPVWEVHRNSRSASRVVLPVRKLSTFTKKESL